MNDFNFFEAEPLEIEFGDTAKLLDTMAQNLKSLWYKDVLKIQSLVLKETNRFFDELSLDPVVLPVTAGSITSPMGLGSDSLPVEVNIFGVKTYLVDSMQFHLEFMCRYYEKGAFYIMPTFRGEEPDARHLNQFFHVEAEMKCDIDNLICILESYIKYLAKSIIEKTDTLTIEKYSMRERLEKTIGQSFKRIRFEDCYKLIGNSELYFNFYEMHPISLTNLGEQKLLEIFKSPVWVTHFPKISVPFYQADEENTDYSLSADLLMGIGETIGCGQRHISANNLQKALELRRVSVEEYEWYIHMKSHTPMLTSGFGMGLERFLAWVFNINDIRTLSPIKRIKGQKSLP